MVERGRKRWALGLYIMGCSFISDPPPPDSCRRTTVRDVRVFKHPLHAFRAIVTQVWVEGLSDLTGPRRVVKVREHPKNLVPASRAHGKPEASRGRSQIRRRRTWIVPNGKGGDRTRHGTGLVRRRRPRLATRSSRCPRARCAWARRGRRKSWGRVQAHRRRRHTDAGRPCCGPKRRGDPSAGQARAVARRFCCSTHGSPHASSEEQQRHVSVRRGCRR